MNKPSLQRIDVISFGGGSNLPLWAGQEQGLFEREGLDVALHITADSKQVFAGLMDGRYQVAMTAFDNIVAYQEGQGEVTFDAPTDFFAFMGSDDGFLSLVASLGVSQIADLKGRQVSVDAMGNGFSFALRELLVRGGVDPKDVQWAQAGGTDRRYAALVEGQHAATMLRAPFDLMALDRGCHCLATVRDAIGPYMAIVGAARRTWAQGHPPELRAFIRGYHGALRWLRDPAHLAQALATLQAHVPSMGEDLARRSLQLMLDPLGGFFADLRIDQARAATVLSLRSRHAEGCRPLTDPWRYCDASYRDNALSEGQGGAGTRVHP